MRKLLLICVSLLIVGWYACQSLEPQDPTGQYIKTARLKKGLSKEELGDLIGLTSHNITSIESGRAMPTREIIVEMEKILDCDIYLDGVPTSD